MRVTGGHTLVLTGANALTGATTIDANNTLKGAVGNIPGDVVANGTLDFTQDTDATYSNTITGAATGAVIKDGAGTLTVSGTNNYAGTTTVNAGEFDITGTTTSGTVTVAAPVTGSSTVTGGTLGGTGMLNADIVNFGIVSPGTVGTPLGTLNQTGNYTGNNGSTFVTTINGSNNSELVTTGDVAVHTGSTVQFDINGPVQNGTRYVAIETTGGAVTVDPGVTYKTNRFFVSVTESNSASEVAGTLNESFVPTAGRVTFNQRQIGQYLDANMSNTNTDFQAILTALGSISNGDEALDALTQLTGDIHPTMAQVNVNNTQVVIQQIAERLRAGTFAPCGPLAVAADGTPIGAAGRVCGLRRQRNARV